MSLILSDNIPHNFHAYWPRNQQENTNKMWAEIEGWSSSSSGLDGGRTACKITQFWGNLMPQFYNSLKEDIKSYIAEVKASKSDQRLQRYSQKYEAHFFSQIVSHYFLSLCHHPHILKMVAPPWWPWHRWDCKFCLKTSRAATQKLKQVNRTNGSRDICKNTRHIFFHKIVSHFCPCHLR